MNIRGTSILFVPAFAVALLLGGCSEERPERAVTVEPRDDDAQSSGVDVESGDDASDGELGEPLTREQIDAALLRVQDLPSGWSKQKNEPDDESEDTIEPRRCQEVIEALDEGFEAEPAHEGETTFNKGGPFGTTFVHSIATYEEQIDPDAAQEIADAFGSCPEFTSTDAEGTKSDISVSPMSFDNLGDQTLAFAMTVNSEGFEVSLNIAMVFKGHNISTFFSGGITGADGAELEKLARSGMKRLESASS